MNEETKPEIPYEKAEKLQKKINNETKVKITFVSISFETIGKFFKKIFR